MKEVIRKNIVKIFQNVFSLFAVRAADLLITVLLIPIIIQKIGVTFYGNYVYVYAYAMFFVNLMAYGFDLSAVRDISKAANSKKISIVFNEVISVKLLLFALITAVYFCLGYLFFKNDKQLLNLMIFSFSLLLAELLSFRWFYYGVLKNWILAIISIISSVIFCYWIFFKLDEGSSNFYYLPFCQSVGYIFIGVFIFFYTIKKYKIDFRLIPFKECMSYLNQHFTSFVNLLIPSILANTVIFFVGAFGSPLNASISQLAIKFTNVFSTANTILTQVLFPFVNRMKSAFSISAVFLCLVGITVSLTMYLTSVFLVENWLTSEKLILKENVVDLIKILSPTPLLMAVISAYGVNGLVVSEKDLVYARINLFIIVMTIVFCFFAIDFNYLAAAIILLLVRLVYALMVYFSYKKIN